MKSKFIQLLLLSTGAIISGQVGINTITPSATLDIVAQNQSATSVDGLLIPRVDRLKASNMASVPNGTLIFVNNIGTGTASGQAINITTTGFYYFEGTVWQKVTTTATNGTNISGSTVKLGGALTEATTIGTSASNTLALTGLATTTNNTKTLTVNASGVISSQTLPGAAATLAGSSSYDRSDGSSSATNLVGATMVVINNTTTTMTLTTAKSIFFNANVGIDDYTLGQLGTPYYKAELYLDDLPITSPSPIFTAAQINGASVNVNDSAVGTNRYGVDGVGGSINFTLSGIINVPAGTHTVKLYMRKSFGNGFSGTGDLRLIAYSASATFIN